MQEKYYEQLKAIASSYSLHNKFVPILLFDLPRSVTHTSDRLPDVVVFDQNQSTILRPFGRRRRQAILSQNSQRVFQSAIHPTPDPGAVVAAKSDPKIVISSNGHQSNPNQGTVLSLTTLMSQASSSSSPDKNFTSTDSDQNITWRPYQDNEECDLTAFKKIRLKIFFVVSNPLFEFAVTAFIFFNTLCLSLEYHGMNPFFKKALVALNHVSILHVVI